MPASPKPTKRGQKPRRPIARSKKPIARNKRPPRVSACPARQEELRKDREWSKAVKAKGPCAALGAWPIGRTEQGSNYTLVHRTCSGPIDPAHILPRTWAATRHLVDNGMPLCRETHRWFGEHPMEWESFVVIRIGLAAYESLRQKAVAGAKA